MSYSTFVTKTVAPGVYIEIALPDKPAWTNAVTPIAVDTEQRNGGLNYRCTVSHTPDTTPESEPGAGENWQDYWELIEYPLLAADPGGGFGLNDPRGFIDPTEPSTPAVFHQAHLGPVGYGDFFALAIYTTGESSTQGQLTALDIANWQPGPYTINDVVLRNGTLRRCRGTHTAVETVGGVIGNEPESAATPTAGGPSGLVLWDELDGQDIGVPRIADRGEMDASYGAVSATQVLSCNAYVRRNRLRLGLTGFIANFGSSSGAVNTLQAAAIGGLPNVESPSLYATHVEIAADSGSPDVVILDICPTRWDLMATDPDQAAPGFSLFMSFLTSFYGDPRLLDLADWKQYGDAKKREPDGYWIVHSRRELPPVYMTNYAQTWGSGLTSRWDDAPAFDVYNGNSGTSQPIDVHHALHAKVLAEIVAAPLSEGGMGFGNSETGGTPDFQHVQKGLATDEMQVSRRYPGGANGVEGTDFEVIDTAPLGFMETLGRHAIDWIKSKIV